MEVVEAHVAPSFDTWKPVGALTVMLPDAGYNCAPDIAKLWVDELQLIFTLPKDANDDVDALRAPEYAETANTPNEFLEEPRLEPVTVNDMLATGDTE